MLNSRFWKRVLHDCEMVVVKKGVSRQHTTFTSCQKAACSNEFFSLAGRLCSGGKSFGLANAIFAAYFTLRGRDTHIEFLWLFFWSE